MKKLGFLLVLFVSNYSNSQQYFQQKVDYTIQVTLNDVNNTLSAYEEFIYTNNSKCTLEFLYIHLWPNAYKNNETALAKQLYDMGNMSLQFATEEERGWIDSLDFKVNGEAVKWTFDPEHIDIAKVYLNKPLNPGEKITVSTPFKVKIPSGKISRLGHVGESFQITQWYPKPAVFDVDGWHQMPYLTQGEFYSEYGSFDVTLTLPKNYVVGSTGDLQTAEEFKFLDEKVKETKHKYESDLFSNTKKISGGNTPFPKSSTEYKTIKYIQKEVHDFAWFADKRFEVLKGEVELPHSKRKVTTWCMFVPHHYKLWENSIEYINDGTYWYSKWNGDYPYNNVTAVDGTISAGGGMEYPNVTVIGNASSKAQLEVVIVHEVGHNWFYGQLGSNEREHPWMDEGLNTLNEQRYIEHKYPENTQGSDMLGFLANVIHLEHMSHYDMGYLTYATSASFGVDQPIELPAADYSSLNYGAIVYMKTGLEFNYLRNYLGDELFDKCMRTYYEKWEFKHPQPNDVKQAFEEVTGKNLDWFFNDIINTTKQIDYKIKKVKVTDNGTDVTVKRKDKINSPVRVDAYSLGNYRGSKWVEPGDKKQTVHFEQKTFDEIKIDGAHKMPELNRNNNYWHKKGIFGKIDPIKFEFLAGDNNPNQTEIWYTPIAGYNIYDKFMIGALFHNVTIPTNKFEYVIAPMYSFGRKNVSGFANLKYKFLPAKNFKTISVGVKGKTFKNEVYYQRSEYMVAHPYIDFAIGKPKVKKNYKQNLLLQGAYIFEKSYTNIGLIEYQSAGGFAKYDYDFHHRRQTYGFNVQVDYLNELNSNRQFSNLLLNTKYKIKYLDKKNKKLRKNITISAFYGLNLFRNFTYDYKYAFAPGGQTGNQDYFYNSYLFGRNETSGFWSQQRLNNQGGMNTTSQYGVNNNWLFTTNLSVELPYVPYIKLYADLGLFELGNNLETLYDFGLSLELLDGNIGVYLPLYTSSSMFAPNTTYAQKIKFILNLNGMNPTKIIQKSL
jgi:hypothetical protein